MSEELQSPAREQPSANGRDGKGRFSKGWKGGPGNPLGSKVDKLRSALLGAVTKEDIEAIAKRLVLDAQKGDVQAVHELFDRIFGKAKEAIVVTGADGGAVQHDLNHKFDHERFAELYLQRSRRNRDGEPVASPNGN